ncbi:MAG: hypothetical protein ACK5JF_06925 [Oscillospiraceae bacterium]
MKKILPLFSAMLCALFLLSACGGSSVRLQQSSSAPVSVPASSAVSSLPSSEVVSSLPEISQQNWSSYTFTLADYNISVKLPKGFSINVQGSEAIIEIDYSAFEYPYWGQDDGFTTKIGNFYMTSMEEETIREVDKNTYEAQSYGSWVTYTYSENHTERTFYHYNEYVSFIQYGTEDWSFFYNPQYAFILQYWLHPDYAQQGIALMEEIVSTVQVS